MYRDDIGYVDLVWGENDSKNRGYGLKHIIEKHGEQIKELGFNVEDFIPIIFQYGNLLISKTSEEYMLESQMFRIVIERTYKGKKKCGVLTAFDLRKRHKKGKK